jgi:hypothetical protein
MSGVSVLCFSSPTHLLCALRPACAGRVWVTQLGLAFVYYHALLPFPTLLLQQVAYTLGSVHVSVACFVCSSRRFSAHTKPEVHLIPKAVAHNIRV